MEMYQLYISFEDGILAVSAGGHLLGVDGWMQLWEKTRVMQVTDAEDVRTKEVCGTR